MPCKEREKNLKQSSRNNENSTIRVLLGPSTFGASDKAPLEKLAEKGFEIIENPFKRKIKKVELIELLASGINGLIAGLETLDSEVFESSQLQVISRCGSGISNVDLKSAKLFGIKVFSTPFGPTNAVSELTIGCLLSLLREINRMDKAMKGGRWVKCIGKELSGKTVAVIGFGRIGRRVSELLTAFNAKVIAVDPICSDIPENITKVELDDALSIADIITLHCSGEGEIIGKSQIKKMKTGSILLNASRGTIVDEKALLEGLESGKGCRGMD